MASKAKVFIVKHEYQAGYKVCFARHEYQEKDAEIITGGNLVDRESQADVKVFIVKHEYQATITITRENFPS